MGGIFSGEVIKGGRFISLCLAETFCSLELSYSRLLSKLYQQIPALRKRAKCRVKPAALVARPAPPVIAASKMVSSTSKAVVSEN